jgi:lipoprotein-releasing system ATP-binding protein
MNEASAQTPSGAVFELRAIKRVFEVGDQKLEVLKGADLKVNAGEIVALVGPSGAGKSTLLHIAGLLERPSEGAVFIAGALASSMTEAERTRIRREDIGFVYQFHHLLPEFTALENVMLPQLIAGKKRAVAEASAKRLLTRLGLEERLTHRPSRLSGGEQQRVAIARAMANGPRILLADEPTGNLDPKTARRVFDEFVALARSENVAAVIATHNLQLAGRMDRAVLLHEGKLIDGRELVK